MKKGMNDHNIGIRAIDARRQHKIEGGTAKRFVHPTVEPIQMEPEEELEKVGARYGGNLMPINAPCVPGGETHRNLNRKIFHALGVEMNFAVVIPGETLEEFC